MSIRCGHCKDRHETVAEVRSCSAPAAPKPRQQGPATEGVYRRGERIYRVVVKAGGSGRPYAEEYVRGAYVYAKGMVFQLRPEERMTLEDARAWGREHVRCVRCATILTKPSSKEAGIGPVCATKV